jgi:hypothetical protein
MEPPTPMKLYHGDAGDEQLGMDPERIEIVGDAFWGDLLVALMVDVMGKIQRARSLGDRGRLVVGGVADAAAEPGGPVARDLLMID